MRIPVDFIAEYRGQQAGGSFVPDGETKAVEYGPKLKFEYEDESGDVQLLPIGGTQLDRAEPAFDHTTLTKGDVVRLQGFVNLADRASGRDSYLSIRSVEPAGALVA